MSRLHQHALLATVSCLICLVLTSPVPMFNGHYYDFERSPSPQLNIGHREPSPRQQMVQQGSSSFGGRVNGSDLQEQQLHGGSYSPGTDYFYQPDSPHQEDLFTSYDQATANPSYTPAEDKNADNSHLFNSLPLDSENLYSAPFYSAPDRTIRHRASSAQQLLHPDIGTISSNEHLRSSSRVFTYDNDEEVYRDREYLPELGAHWEKLDEKFGFRVHSIFLNKYGNIVQIRKGMLFDVIVKEMREKLTPRLCLHLISKDEQQIQSALQVILPPGNANFPPTWVESMAPE
jgi:hypothetical protein